MVRGKSENYGAKNEHLNPVGRPQNPTPTTAFVTSPPNTILSSQHPSSLLTQSNPTMPTTRRARTQAAADTAIQTDQTKSADSSLGVPEQPGGYVE